MEYIHSRNKLLPFVFHAEYDVGFIAGKNTLPSLTVYVPFSGMIANFIILMNDQTKHFIVNIYNFLNRFNILVVISK